MLWIELLNVNRTRRNFTSSLRNTSMDKINPLCDIMYAEPYIEGCPHLYENSLQEWLLIHQAVKLLS